MEETKTYRAKAVLPAKLKEAITSEALQNGVNLKIFIPGVLQLYTNVLEKEPNRIKLDCILPGYSDDKTIELNTDVTREEKDNIKSACMLSGVNEKTFIIAAFKYYLIRPDYKESNIEIL